MFPTGSLSDPRGRCITSSCYLSRKRKFSDKERDEETGLDYFGARYYSSKNYRWLSVDPIVSNSKALSNAQLWNLYSFCRNNPIAFIDPDGRVIEVVGSDTFTKQVKEMMDYLKQCKWAANILHALEVSTEVIIISEATDFAFKEHSLTIEAAPLSGLWIETSGDYDPFRGSIQSPALALIHECIHASSYINDREGFMDNKKMKAIPSVFGSYGDFNEAWAVAYESRIAAQLNEPQRYNSQGIPIKVESPTYSRIGYR